LPKRYAIFVARAFRATKIGKHPGATIRKFSRAPNMTMMPQVAIAPRGAARHPQSPKIGPGLEMTFMKMKDQTGIPERFAGRAPIRL
jgi:hypothetical protein